MGSGKVGKTVGRYFFLQQITPKGSCQSPTPSFSSVFRDCLASKI